MIIVLFLHNQSNVVGEKHLAFLEKYDALAHTAVMHLRDRLYRQWKWALRPQKFPESDHFYYSDEDDLLKMFNFAKCSRLKQKINPHG